MSAPLRKVSENFHLTVKRAKIATVVTPHLSDALSDRSRSTSANPIGARGLTRPSAEVQNGYRSDSSFTPLPCEGINPPGLYTAIVHNGPLRTRIQDHLDELGDFKAHTRCARELFFGWLVTLYYLMLVVAWNTLESTTHRLVGLYRRHVRARISWIPCIAWIKQAMHSAVVWFLPTLLAIRKSVFEANSRLRRDLEVNSRPRSISEAKRTSPVTPVHAKFVNGPQHSISVRYHVGDPSL